MASLAGPLPVLLGLALLALFQLLPSGALDASGATSGGALGTSSGGDAAADAAAGSAATGVSGGQCLALVERYLEKHAHVLSPEQDPNKFLFFLHVPRTAGKTYYTCFLKSAYPPSRRCAKSYDLLRLNISSDSCTLLSSHDDMSIADSFPPGAAVITQLRQPLSRVISSYEFAIDVAARQVHIDDDKLSNKTANSAFVSTLNVWPWSYLVPWFRRDMRARMAALEKEAERDTSGRPRWLSYKDAKNRTYYWSAETNRSVWTLPEPKNVLDPYNNPLVTPLHEWIELPIAQEVVHNTAVLQILGLTNYSYWPEHKELRACIESSTAARQALQGVAVRRLASMAHVGLTERLDESVLSLAAQLGFKLADPAYKYASAAAFSYDAPDLDESQPITYNSSIHNANVTVSLGEARHRLLWLSNRHINVTGELKVMVPKLVKLLDQEEAWLDEQAAAAAAAAPAAAPAEGSNADSEAPEGQAEEEEALGSGAAEGSQEQEESKEAGGDGAAEAGDGAAEGGADSDGGGAGEEEEQDAQQDAAAAGEEKKGGRRKRSKAAAKGDGESSKAGSGARAGPWRRPVKSNTSKHKRREKKKKNQRTQAPKHPSEETDASSEQEGGKEQAQPEIDSPWAKEIVALDEQVAEMQAEVKRLDWDIWSIQNSGAVRQSDDALGRARQILPDEHFTQHSTLGTSYKHCTKGTKTRHTAGRAKVLKNVKTPWHESFAFSKTARAKIPKHVTDRILELNTLDSELWDLGDKLLSAKVAAQTEAKVLESFERRVPPLHQRVRDSQQGEGKAEADRSGAVPAPDAEHQPSPSEAEGETGGYEYNKDELR